MKKDIIFKNQKGRKIEINSVFAIDGGTSYQFDGFYIDTGLEIDDTDYYFILDTYCLDLDWLAMENY